MGVPELEKPPVRFLGDGVPAALLEKGLTDGCEGNRLVPLHECLITLLPHDKHHGRERQWLFLEDGILAVLDLPLFDKRILI